VAITCAAHLRSVTFNQEEMKNTQLSFP